jgi:hypothetical protein
MLAIIIIIIIIIIIKRHMFAVAGNKNSRLLPKTTPQCTDSFFIARS